MITIRLSRAGSRKNPFYHITVAERAAKRDGRFVERVGFYNPVAKGLSEELRIDLNRIDHWVSVGAKPSAMVDKLVRRARTTAAATEAPDSAAA